MSSLGICDKTRRSVSIYSITIALYLMLFAWAKRVITSQRVLVQNINAEGAEPIITIPIMIQFSAESRRQLETPILAPFSPQFPESRTSKQYWGPSSHPHSRLRGLPCRIVYLTGALARSVCRSMRRSSFGRRSVDTSVDVNIDRYVYRDSADISSARSIECYGPYKMTRLANQFYLFTRMPPGATCLRMQAAAIVSVRIRFSRNMSVTSFMGRGHDR